MLEKDGDKTRGERERDGRGRGWRVLGEGWRVDVDVVFITQTCYRIQFLHS